MITLERISALVASGCFAYVVADFLVDLPGPTRSMLVAGIVLGLIALSGSRFFDLQRLIRRGLSGDRGSVRRTRLSILALNVAVLAYVLFLAVGKITRDGGPDWVAAGILVFIAAVLPGLFAVIIMLDLVEDVRQARRR